MTSLVLAGWDVYRFTYEQVMRRQAWVRSVLLRAEAKARATQEVRAGSPALSASPAATPGFMCRPGPPAPTAGQDPSLLHETVGGGIRVGVAGDDVTRECGDALVPTDVPETGAQGRQRDRLDLVGDTALATPRQARRSPR